MLCDMTGPSEPAHRQFVEAFLDWDLVARRLALYPAIGRAFDLGMLKQRSDVAPYYCHYMAWRLGTWESESLFVRLEELFTLSESLHNWKYERPLLDSSDFSDFWSLVWQLQMAEYLHAVGTNVQWSKSGPDLSVQVGNERWYVECVAPRKSLGLFLFLEELLRRIDSAIHASYDICMRFSLPRDSQRGDFLDDVFGRFQDSRHVEEAKVEAAKRYPVVLYQHPSSSLTVYLEGDDINAYSPGIVPNLVGSPEAYLRVALREAANAKIGANALIRHRPNIVAVNLLLSADYQLARSLRRTSEVPIALTVDPAIDAISLSTVGIDESVTRQVLRIIHGSHSGLSLIGELENIA